ncbi:flagellar protein export ATPase FliI [Pannonibacter sp. Q-1]|mgnify:CR=1 FL=1|uniref:Flagellum-specific ATP synthase n=1 Tax=Pannonibacter phragmitetus TaxID=121719 RepID=A0A0U3PGG7_9HYPH|nr:MULTISPECIES: flagellar protein export ATPase FliI [Pannonibacter]ALV26317.1 flagellar protein export ATPase FliI [Pannonibacter phragmitetus]MBA4205124.1 flagellar protein export ATPase FliI [Polymorphum sp.]
MPALDRLALAVSAASKEVDPVRIGGRVIQVTPGVIRVTGLSRSVCIGDLVSLEGKGGERRGEIIRLDEDDVYVKPYGNLADIGIGARAWRKGALTVHPHQAWKGRVVNALGQAADGKGPLRTSAAAMSLDNEPPQMLERARARKPVRTGVKVIDLFTPLCVGQRIGVFAGSGVGKSTLLAMLAGSGDFDTVVVGLVGERGREVREFVEDVLGDALERSVVVVATGDESAMMRRLAPRTAMSVAEYFRGLGQSVLLIIDSATRFAHAARDVAMAAGEPPVARGYTPSVFSDLTRLLERAGPGAEGEGAITGVFSVLVDGDDHNDPVADTMRGVLDGHIVLDRAIADAGRYPAVNILSSVSRLSQHAWTPEERELIMRLKAMISRYEDTRDLRLMGGYQAGSDPALDKAVQLVPRIYEFLRQDARGLPSPDPFGDLARALSS